MGAEQSPSSQRATHRSGAPGQPARRGTPPQGSRLLPEVEQAEVGSGRAVPGAGRAVPVQRFAAAGLPIVSVDTKKKELIGNFARGGRSWCRNAPEVDEHDFPSQAVCQAVPFGVYDVTRNAGFVVVGTSHNTPQFAVSAIA